MLHHPYLLEEPANDHCRNLLEEADSYRIAPTVKKEQRVKVSLLKPMVSCLRTLLIDPALRLASQGSPFTDMTTIGGYR